MFWWRKRRWKAKSLQWQTWAQFSRKSCTGLMKDVLVVGPKELQGTAQDASSFRCVACRLQQNCIAPRALQWLVLVPCTFSDSLDWKDTRCVHAAMAKISCGRSLKTWFGNGMCCLIARWLGCCSWALEALWWFPPCQRSSRHAWIACWCGLLSPDAPTLDRWCLGHILQSGGCPTAQQHIVSRGMASAIAGIHKTHFTLDWPLPMDDCETLSFFQRRD